MFRLLLDNFNVVKSDGTKNISTWFVGGKTYETLKIIRQTLLIRICFLKKKLFSEYKKSDIVIIEESGNTSVGD